LDFICISPSDFCCILSLFAVKKVSKWSCKVCGLKQSFGRGSGADCRRHVQKLNAAQGAKMEENEVRSREKRRSGVFQIKSVRSLLIWSRLPPVHARNVGNVNISPLPVTQGH
uniref:MRN complex-interacting protein N-terminal domain-containing protein n=1 Tax=Neogobius melanostomus TaxID=47308 RepID=A0A8C6S433_9GOBI